MSDCMPPAPDRRRQRTAPPRRRERSGVYVTPYQIQAPAPRLLSAPPAGPANLNLTLTEIGTIATFLKRVNNKIRQEQIIVRGKLSLSSRDEMDADDFANFRANFRGVWQVPRKQELYCGGFEPGSEIC